MDNATNDIEHAPIATPFILRQRKNVLFQLWRFVALNVRFVTMIFKGEH